MLIYKCDRCKKTITDSKRNQSISAGVGFDRFELCSKCGSSIVRILKGYKLIKNET